MADRRYRPLGLGVEVRSLDPRPIELLDQVFEPTADDSPSDLRLRVASESGVERGARPSASFEVALPELSCLLGASWSRGNVDSGDVQAELRRSEWGYPERIRDVLLVTPILCAMSRRKAVVFHAAGLVTADGRAILLRAAAEGGKSTLACAWALGGGGVLSDETCWLPADGGGELHGFGLAIDVRPDAARFFPGASFESIVTASGEAKLQLALGTLRRRRASLAAFVVLDRRTEGDAALLPMPARTALEELATTAIPQEAPQARQSELLARHLERVPAYRLQTGGDPRRGVELLRRLLG